MGSDFLFDSIGNKIPRDAFIIRHTEISEFRNCQRKWALSSHNGANLKPRLKDAKLADGSCWHRGLEYFYSNRSFEEGYLLQFAEEKEKMEKVIGDGIYDDTVQQDLESRKALALELFEHYKEWARTTADPSDKDLSVLGVEKRIVVPLRSPSSGRKTKAWLAAKLDAIVKLNGVYFIMEHKYLGKSTRVDNPSILQLDLQMGIQLWVLSEYLKVHDRTARIGGALYNLTRKQKPGTRVTAPIFGRHLVMRSGKELRQLAIDLYNDSQRMRKVLKNPAEITYNPQAFGICGWGCPYRNVCESQNRGENIEMLIEANFRPREKTIWELLEEEVDT